MAAIQPELAEIIISYMSIVIDKFPEDKIPKRLLILRYEGNKGVGNYILQLSFLRYLDRFSEKANIVDETGKRFHFTANGFKHRFSLKLFEMGLYMAQVHQLIANVTSEMPMKYARIYQKVTLNNEGWPSDC